MVTLHAWCVQTNERYISRVFSHADPSFCFCRVGAQARSSGIPADVLQWTMVPIIPIVLPVPGLVELRADARAEGFNFLDTLVNDWASGVNCFDAPGEVLCGHFDQGMLVAVGGLNIDPFAGDPEIGRIRRVYVRSAWRNRGVGRALVMHLVEYARRNFKWVRLRAENDGAARLYERLGFVPTESPEATHIFIARQEP